MGVRCAGRGPGAGAGTAGAPRVGRALGQHRPPGGTPGQRGASRPGGAGPHRGRPHGSGHRWFSSRGDTSSSSVRPLSRITDRERTGILVTQLIAADIALFACHTNLDGAAGGLCELVAGEFGLVRAWPLVRPDAGWKKLVGFVPEDALERVSAAVFATGAGRIGGYDDCAFRAMERGASSPRSGPSPRWDARAGANGLRRCAGRRLSRRRGWRRRCRRSSRATPTRSRPSTLSPRKRAVFGRARPRGVRSGPATAGVAGRVRGGDAGSVRGDLYRRSRASGGIGGRGHRQRGQLD